MKKKKLSGYNVAAFAILLAAGIFILFYPFAVRYLIVSSYKKHLSEALGKLDGKEKQAAEEKLAQLEGKRSRFGEDHNTDNFLHSDYFEEPWRNWENTYLIWERARNIYLIFLLLYLARYGMDYYDRRHYIKKGVEKVES